jgi:hypothetical protein
MAKSAAKELCARRQMKNRNKASALAAGGTQRATKVKVRSVKAGLYYLDLQSLDHRWAVASTPPDPAPGLIDIAAIELYS